MFCPRFIDCLQSVVLTKQYWLTGSIDETYKGGRRLAITRLYSMWLLTRSHKMINHGLRALLWGLWV